MQGVQAAHCHPVLHQRRHWMCAGEIDPGRWINVPARDTTPLFPRFLLFPWWFSCYFPKPPPAAVPLSRRRVLQSRTNFCSTDSTERTTSPYRSIAFSSWIMNLNEPVTKCVCVCVPHKSAPKHEESLVCTALSFQDCAKHESKSARAKRQGARNTYSMPLHKDCALQYSRENSCVSLARNPAPSAPERTLKQTRPWSKHWFRWW